MATSETQDMTMKNQHSHAPTLTQDKGGSASCCSTRVVPQEPSHGNQNRDHRHHHHQKATEHSCCGSKASKPLSIDRAAHNTMVDAVCGMTVAANSPLSATHDGKQYAFCSAGCRTKFV